MNTEHEEEAEERRRTLHARLWAAIAIWAAFSADSISVAKQNAVVALEEALERYATAHVLNAAHVHRVVAESVRKTLDQLRTNQEILVKHPKAPRSDRSDERFAAGALATRVMTAIEETLPSLLRTTTDDGIPVLTPDGETVYNAAIAQASQMLRYVIEHRGDTADITMGANSAWDALRPELEQLVAAVREEERAQCITEIEMKIRRWSQPDGYIGRPTQRKNDQDVLRTAIHLLYARDKTRIHDIEARVNGLVKHRAPELQR